MLEIRDQRPIREARTNAAFRRPDAGVGEKAKVAGRGLVDRGRGFDNGATKVTKGVSGI